MKTRTLLISAAIAAMLGNSPVNAQLVGGASGALGGSLSGGMRGVDAVTQGAVNGSFGSDFDAGSLHGVASRTATRVGRRAEHSIGTVRQHSRATANEVRGASESVANAAKAHAHSAVEQTNLIESTADTAGSFTSTARLDDAHIYGTNDLSVSNELAAPTASSSANRVTGDGVLDAAPQSHVSTLKSPLPLTARVEGTAQGEASASRRGASASAQGEGSAEALQ